MAPYLSEGLHGEVHGELGEGERHRHVRVRARLRRHVVEPLRQVDVLKYMRTNVVCISISGKVLIRHMVIFETAGFFTVAELEIALSQIHF